VVVVFDVGLIPAAVLAFAASLGLPRWLLLYLKRLRQNRFLDRFPDAIDIVVRGVKSGLLLTVRLIGVEALEPVRTEFRRIMETQAVGVPLAKPVRNLRAIAGSQFLFHRPTRSIGVHRSWSLISRPGA
jgi:tight adherence protein B